MALQQGINSLMTQGATDWAVLTVDLTNAFNSVKRSAVLQSAISTCPESVPWVSSMYGSHSSLYCQSRVLRSESGVQQGDPLGPLLFSWALHPTANVVSSSVPWCSWYLDDGALIGTRPQLESALAALVADSPRTGLQVNLSKCQVWGPAPPTLSPLLSKVSPVPFTPGSGITHLGSPVCHPASWDYASSVVLDRLARCQGVYRALENLPEAHIQYCLLRSTMDACRFNDLLRSIPLGIADSAFTSASLALRSAFETCLGSVVSPDQWAQVCLPIRMGGLGLRDPISIRAAARVPTIVSYCCHALSAVPFLESDPTPLPPPDTAGALAALSFGIGPHPILTTWSSDLSMLSTAVAPQTSQGWWTELFFRTQKKYFTGVLHWPR